METIMSSSIIHSFIRLFIILFSRDIIFSSDLCEAVGENISIDTTPEFQNEILATINKIRLNHGESILQLDSNLTHTAAKWGTLLHRKAKLDGVLKSWYSHSNTEGEAVYTLTNNTNKNSEKNLSSLAVMSWYCEIAKFNFSDNIFRPNTAQFSQLVWSNTKKIGIAKVVNNETGEVAIVARFTPLGNWHYVHDFQENVHKPRTFEFRKICMNSDNDTKPKISPLPFGRPIKLLPTPVIQFRYRNDSSKNNTNYEMAENIMREIEKAIPYEYVRKLKPEREISATTSTTTPTTTIQPFPTTTTTTEIPPPKTEISRSKFVTSSTTTTTATTLKVEETTTTTTTAKPKKKRKHFARRFGYKNLKEIQGI